jgi:hypothetical protein
MTPKETPAQRSAREAAARALNAKGDEEYAEYLASLRRGPSPVVPKAVPVRPAPTSNPTVRGPIKYPRTPSPTPADSVDRPVTTGIFATVGGKAATGLQRAINANLKVKENNKS